MSNQTSIEVQGVKQTVAALKAFTPDIHKALTKSIREALKFTQEVAKSKYPSGAWSIRINQKKVLGSITTASGAKAVRWGESSGGVRAAIFEFAGAVQSGKTPQAQALIASLNSRYGSTGRFLWAAWDETGNGVLESIRYEVLKAERQLQAHLEETGQAF